MERNLLIYIMKEWKPFGVRLDIIILGGVFRHTAFLSCLAKIVALFSARVFSCGDSLTLSWRSCSRYLRRVPELHLPHFSVGTSACIQNLCSLLRKLCHISIGAVEGVETPCFELVSPKEALYFFGKARERCLKPFIWIFS